MGSEGAAGEPSVLRASARDVVPWRNGAGTTTVVAEGPPAEGGPATEPAWRISIATIDRSAPFSEFAGVDRLLMPLSPAGLDLVIDGRRVRGEAFDVLPFAGESAVEAVDVRGTGLDLNLMTRRGSAAGTLVARHLDGELTLRSPGTPGTPASPSSWTVAVVVEGDVTSPTHGALALHDAVVIPPGGAVQLTGRTAMIALAVIESTRAS